jgi:hypothetical protein
MYNTGLENEDQLKIVRNEVKAKYNTESAMWASFKCPGPDGGRGVGVLVLGPLAPRTGWIVSDSCGHILSASSRVKPGLPVLCFIACDCYIPPLEPTPFESMHLENLSTAAATSTLPSTSLSFFCSPGESERKDKVFQKLKEIIQGEHEKGVFVFAAGQIVSNITRLEHDTANNESFFKEHGLVQMPVRGLNGSSPTAATTVSSIDAAAGTTTSPPPFVASPTAASTTTAFIGSLKNKKTVTSMAVDDVLVTYQPYGDGPRSPDGTGMKVLSTEALEVKVTSPHYPTLIQIAVYGWPSDTFLFSPKCDTPLSSGRKSRRNKSGRKKEDQFSPQALHQLSISPRHQDNNSCTPSPYYPSSASAPPPLSSSPLSSSSSNLTHSLSLHHHSLHSASSSSLISSPREAYPSSSHLHRKHKILEFQTRLHDILHSTSWGVVRLDQMKYLLHELFRWIECITSQLDLPGYPTTQSIFTLQELYSYNADQFLKTAPEMMGQIFQNWLKSADEVINASSLSSAAASSPPTNITTAMNVMNTTTTTNSSLGVQSPSPAPLHLTPPSSGR